VALERNNTTTQFEPGCDPEFEQVLRRHLKLGGAPVAACVGFDADTASAFLENALSSTAHAKFESHLAGCPVCRRHLIELSQLIGPISAPIAVHVKTDRLAALKQWFDFSSWGWKQQTAGLAATALLIGAVSSPLWLTRSESKRMPADMAASFPGGQVEALTAPVANRGRVETPAAGPAESPASNADLALSRQRSNEAGAAPQEQATGAAKPQIPAPSVPARVENYSIVQDMARESVFNSANRIELPIIANMGYSPPPVASFQPRGTDILPLPIVTPAPEPPSAEAEATVAQTQTFQNLVGLQVSPKPDDNPMLDAKSERSRAASTQKSFPRAGLTSLVPIRRGDREEKPAAPARDEEEGTRSLLRKIRDRRFRFENDIWMDEEYTPNMRWRVKRLIRGSAEFDDVLEREPQLKVFFEKAPILVIWRDRIYKVVIPHERPEKTK
jgi:hypothetical protein